LQTVTKQDKVILLLSLLDKVKLSNVSTLVSKKLLKDQRLFWTVLMTWLGVTLSPSPKSEVSQSHSILTSTLKLKFKNATVFQLDQSWLQVLLNLRLPP